MEKGMTVSGPDNRLVTDPLRRRAPMSTASVGDGFTTGNVESLTELPPLPQDSGPAPAPPNPFLVGSDSRGRSLV